MTEKEAQPIIRPKGFNPDYYAAESARLEVVIGNLSEELLPPLSPKTEAYLLTCITLHNTFAQILKADISREGFYLVAADDNRYSAAPFTEISNDIVKIAFTPTEVSLNGTSPIKLSMWHFKPLTLKLMEEIREKCFNPKRNPDPNLYREV